MPASPDTVTERYVTSAPRGRLELGAEAQALAHPRDGLADLVVRRRRAGGEPDAGGSLEPLRRRLLVLAARWLMTHRARDGIDAVRVLDVEAAHPARLHQRGELAGVAGVVAAHDHHQVERLLEQRAHGVLPVLRRRADGVERAEVLRERLGSVAALHALAQLGGDRER